MGQDNEMEMNRRDFVTAAAVAAAGLGMFACGLQGVCAQTTQPSAAGPIDVGPKSNFSKDGPAMDWVKTHHVILVRANGKLYAMGSKCTHRGRDVVVEEDHLHCTWHGSNFADDGTVTNGPARQALPRYAISVNDAGNVVVDPSKKFTQDQWDDPASFVAVS